MRPVLLVALLFAGLSPTAASAEPADAPNTAVTLVLKVYDYAAVPPRSLAKAEELATRILGQAGVRLIWVPCPSAESDRSKFPDCSRLHAQTELTLKILPAFRPMGGLPADALGFAFVPEGKEPGLYAYVSYERVRAIHIENRVSEELLLGHAAAHEIGHLLLGSNAHTRTGIMAAHWYRSEWHKAAQGNLLFTSAQAEAMRRDVSARLHSDRPLVAAKIQ